MGFTRVATFRSVAKLAVIIEVDGETVEISHAALATHDTPAKLKAEAERQAGKGLAVFFHINRDGSIALATGAAPGVWPEDTEED